MMMVWLSDCNSSCKTRREKINWSVGWKIVLGCSNVVIDRVGIRKKTWNDCGDIGKAFCKSMGKWRNTFLSSTIDYIIDYRLSVIDGEDKKEHKEFIQRIRIWEECV